MQVDHKHYNLPPSIGPLQIQPLTWQQFKASPPHNSPFLAHIYWSINYEFPSFTQGQPVVQISVHVRPKSWKAIQEQALLKHQYGHYLIGCLCALSFAKKVNFEIPWNPSTDFGTWCKQILRVCLKQYCKMEKIYDEQTDHYLNQQMQLRWQSKIRNQLMQFDMFFKSKDTNQLQKKEKRIIELNHNNLMNAGGINKIKVRNEASKKVSFKKDPNSQFMRFTRKQLTISKKSINDKGENCLNTQVNSSMTNVLLKIRQFKKTEQSDNLAPYRLVSIPKKGSLVLRSPLFPKSF